MRAEDFVRLANAFPEACLLVRATGEIVAANRAAGEALRCPPQALRGRTLHALAAEPPERVQAALGRFAAGGTMLPARLALRGDDGAVADFRCEGAVVAPAPARRDALLAVRLRPHSAASEQFLMLTRRVDALTREVHQRRRAEAALEEQTAQLEELATELEQTIDELYRQKEEAQAARAVAEQASQAKSDFLATMSHELRTPLNAIIGYAELLDMGVGGPLTELQHLHLARVGRSARHLLQLIDEVLTFSRLEAGREPLRVEEADLAEVAREAAELMEPAAAERALSLRLFLPPHPVPALTDPARVRQVLLNLLSNAVKFTERGEIAVSLRVEGPWALLAVRDTGIGIAPHDQPNVFDPFVQVDSSRTRRVGGTGLGLSVSRQLTALLGGELTLSSAAGKGSTFVLRLPLAGPPAS